MKDIRKHAADLNEFLSAEVDPRAMAAVREVGNEIAGLLGESPERWFGAITLMYGILEPLTNPGDYTSAQAVKLATIVMAELSARPPGVLALEELHRGLADRGES